MNNMGENVKSGASDPCGHDDGVITIPGIDVRQAAGRSAANTSLGGELRRLPSPGFARMTLVHRRWLSGLSRTQMSAQSLRSQ